MKKVRAVFEIFKIKQIPQEGNAHTDSLATLTSVVNSESNRVILVSSLSSPSIGKDEVNDQTH